MNVSRAMLAIGLACAAACSHAEQSPTKESPALRALLDRCRAAMNTAPKDAHARAELALAFEANGLWSEAAKNYQAARELQPDEPLWSLHNAICLVETGEQESYLPALESAATRFPDCAPIQQRYGLILLEDGAFERARSLFEHLTRLEPRLADGWANLAEVEIADGKFPAALDAAEHALSLDASYKLPRYLRGRCLQELGREKEAQEELARAGIAQRRMLGDAWSERIPEFAVGFEARFARAVQLLQSDRNAEARAAFELLMHERPRDVRTLGNLAMAQAATGNLDAAIVSCDAALGIEPNSATLHAARARVMLGGRRVEDALLDARRATELDAQDASNFELFGFALAASGDNAAALTAWSESLRLDPSNTDLHRRVELLRLRR